MLLWCDFQSRGINYMLRDLAFLFVDWADNEAVNYKYIFL